MVASCEEAALVIRCIRVTRYQMFPPLIRVTDDVVILNGGCVSYNGTAEDLQNCTERSRGQSEYLLRKYMRPGW